jgi:hypothetical protein
LRWSGGGVGDVEIVLGTMGEDFRSLECRIPSTALALSVPSALLAALAESGAAGALLVRAISTRGQRLGDWDISFGASSNDVQSEVIFGD